MFKVSQRIMTRKTSWCQVIKDYSKETAIGKRESP